MNINDQFLSLYNQFDGLLRAKYRIESRTISCVKRYEDELKGSAFKSNRNRGFAIESIRNVRNTLIHDAKIYSFEAFVISYELIDFLNREINLLTNPKKVIDIATKKDNIFMIDKSLKINAVIKYMSEQKISHAPIVDFKNRVIGVFSESTLYSYLLKNDSLSIDNNMIVNDILEYTNIENHTSERFIFVKENELLDDIQEDFIKKSKHEKRLVMIFITENGKQNEPLLGILTAIDLLNEKI